MNEKADWEIRARIGKLGDGIQDLITRAAIEHNMTVAEIIGVLETCKASVIEAASEVVTI